MKSKYYPLFRCLCISFLVFTCASVVGGTDGQEKLETYIVFVRPTDNIIDISLDINAESWHTSLLSTVCKFSAPQRLIYSYNKLVNGFAAKLTQEEVAYMSKEPWFVSAMLASRPYRLMTTHTPKFLQLRGANGLWRSTKNMGEGVIIGVLDSGIWPGHPSFNDKGMPPPPAKWKGHCDFNKTVCNNKLIGAKSFFKAGADELKHVSPFDVDEHGTHTASTAAGTFVKKTDLLENAMGPASGVAPRAHIAVYRVCSRQGCESADIFKAIEEAVNDGCDVLSLSLGSESSPYYMDPVALGGFFAMLKGVFVSAAAGNDGPSVGSVSNSAPWLLTVAASTTDRQIRSIVKLGNGLQLYGESMNQPKSWANKMLQLVYLGGKGKVEAGQCNADYVHSNDVRGKIVICDRGGNGRVEKGKVVLQAGGLGMILMNGAQDGFSTLADDHVLPASHICFHDSKKLMKYIGLTNNPVATFNFKGMVLHNHWSPSIASFSSRGYNLPSPNIIKPDITGPGVGIVAAVPPKIKEGKTVMFDFMSGTSMAAPHLSGVAALVKKVHPNWSPAAIKSAIMTTAYTKNLDGRPITDENHFPANVFAMGSGHVDPKKAVDPGLIYDITPEDYIKYICGVGFKDSYVDKTIFPAPPVHCERVKSIIPEEQLNYPSITVPLPVNGTIVVIHRTVTNVGKANATYKAAITASQGLILRVEPSVLQFNSLNEKKSFELIAKWGIGNANGVPFGELKWVSDSHVVRSTIGANIQL
ncbi:hypothetical protein LUZ60_016773 [Juncus effusus]|nr:hypothetical protein LUZ60_016773 [Juncus effusus]